jgi:hypothetical protein
MHCQFATIKRKLIFKIESKIWLANAIQNYKLQTYVDQQVVVIANW